MREADIAIAIALGLCLGLCLGTGLIAICAARHREKNEGDDESRDGEGGL